MLSYKRVADLASAYGDAFYLFEEDKFRCNFSELKSAFKSGYNKFKISYSYKTNYIPYIAKLVDKLGGYAEIVSDMEYSIAKKCGIDDSKIIFNGPYKNIDCVRMLLKNKGQVNIDADFELEKILDIAEKADHILRVALRCNFDINDGVLSRFGYDVDSPNFETAIKKLKAQKNIKLVGFHCHFAARALEHYNTRAQKMAKLIKKHFETMPEYLSLGGGMFGKMSDRFKAQFDTAIPSYQEYANTITDVLNTEFGSEGPMLFIEPGSALVSDTVSFVAKVVGIKSVRGKNIATVLGSAFNINSFGNKKNHPITVYSNGQNQTTYEDMNLAGYTCIESDYLYHGYNGKLAVGDFVLFENVGSYSIVFKPPFILPNFPVLNVDTNNNIGIIKRKETFDDLFVTYEF